jgi:HEAT repeat protein
MLALNVSVRTSTPSSDDIEGLIRQLGENDVTVTHRAKWQLVRHGRRPMLCALKENNPTIRANAAHALALLQDPEAVPELIEALDDEDEYARYRIVYALGELRDDRADAELIRVAEADPSKFVQDAAREALEKIRRAKPMSGIVGAP